MSEEKSIVEEPEQTAIAAEVAEEEKNEPEAKKGFFRSVYDNGIYVIKNRCFSFNGTSSRQEFWQYFLFQIVLQIVVIIVLFLLLALIGFICGALTVIVPPLGAALDIFMTIIGFIGDTIYNLFGLACVISIWAASARRLRDAGMSAWFVLLNLLICVGPITVLIMCTAKSAEPEKIDGEAE